MLTRVDLFTRLRLPLFARCLLVFTYVYTCLPMFATVYSSSLMFTMFTRAYLPMFTLV